MANPGDIRIEEASPKRGAMHPRGYWDTFKIEEIVMNVSGLTIPVVQYLDSAGNVSATPDATHVHAVRVQGGAATDAVTPLDDLEPLAGNLSVALAADNTVLFGLKRRNPLGYTKTYADADGTVFDGTTYYTIGDVFVEPLYHSAAATPEWVVDPPVAIPEPNECLYDFCLLVFDGYRIVFHPWSSAGFLLGATMIDVSYNYQLQKIYREVDWTAYATIGLPIVLEMVPPVDDGDDGLVDPCEWTEDGLPWDDTTGRYGVRPPPNDTLFTSGTITTWLAGAPPVNGNNANPTIVRRPFAIWAKDDINGHGEFDADHPHAGTLPYTIPYDYTLGTQNTVVIDGKPSIDYGHMAYWQIDAISTKKFRRFIRFRPGIDFPGGVDAWRESRRSVRPRFKLKATVFDRTTGDEIESIDLEEHDSGYHAGVVNFVDGNLGSPGVVPFMMQFKVDYYNQFRWWTGRSDDRRANLWLGDAHAARTLESSAGLGFTTTNPDGQITRFYGPSTHGAATQLPAKSRSFSKYPLYFWLGSCASGGDLNLGQQNIKTVEAFQSEPIDVAFVAVSDTDARIQERADAVDPVAKRPAIVTVAPFLAGRLVPFVGTYLDEYMSATEGRNGGGMSGDEGIRFGYGLHAGLIAPLLVPRDEVTGRTIRINVKSLWTGLQVGVLTATTDSWGWWEVATPYGTSFMEYSVTVDTYGTQTATTAVISFVIDEPAQSADNIYIYFTSCNDSEYPYGGFSEVGPPPLMVAPFESVRFLPEASK